MLMLFARHIPEENSILSSELLSIQIYIKQIGYSPYLSTRVVTSRISTPSKSHSLVEQSSVVFSFALR